MKKGDILYHEKYGKITVSGIKYSPIGNKAIFIGRDSAGKERPLDGSEIRFSDHFDMESKKAAEIALKSEKVAEKSKKEDTIKKELFDSIENIVKTIQEGFSALQSKELTVETKEVVIPEFPKKLEVNVPDLSGIEKKLDAIVSDVEEKLILQEIVSELKKDRSDKAVSDAIIKIGKLIPTAPNDYTAILAEISSKLIPVVEKESFKIDDDQFKLLTKAIANIRGGGGSGGIVAVMDVSRNQINPATEEKQGVFNEYAPAGQDISGDPMYFAGLKEDGSWYIKRMYLSGDYTTKYANGTSGFDWSSRASLTYADFNTLTW